MTVTVGHKGLRGCVPFYACDICSVQLIPFIDFAPHLSLHLFVSVSDP